LTPCSVSAFTAGFARQVGKLLTRFAVGLSVALLPVYWARGTGAAIYGKSRLTPTIGKHGCYARSVWLVALRPQSRSKRRAGLR